MLLSWQLTNMKVSTINDQQQHKLQEPETIIILILGAGLPEPLPAAAAWPRLGLLSPRPPAQGWGPGTQDLCSGLLYVCQHNHRQSYLLLLLIPILKYCPLSYLCQGPSQLLSNYDGEARKAEAEEGFKMKMRMPKKRGSIVDGRLVRNYHNF